MAPKREPQGAGQGGPARGYRWPPFAEGHTVTLRHGASSPRVFGQLAEELAAGILSRRPDLAAHPEAVGAWATAEAQAALLRKHLAEVGLLDADGQPQPALGALERVERRADGLRQRLGLDPTAQARLARERADAAHAQVDLVAVAAAGREALDAGRVEVVGSGRDPVAAALAAVRDGEEGDGG